MDDVELELEAPAVPASIDLVQDLVAELYGHLAETAPLADRMRFESALVEIIGNIIEHGAPAAGGTALMMRVVLTLCEADLLAVVTDDGSPVEIDLDRASMSSMDDENGRGLAMARALSDELRYERSGRANRWTVRCVRTR